MKAAAWLSTLAAAAALALIILPVAAQPLHTAFATLSLLAATGALGMVVRSRAHTSERTVLAALIEAADGPRLVTAGSGISAACVVYRR